MNPAAFDAIADEYDDQFTDSLLGRWLRQRVWQRLAEQVKPGQHILELACGTGVDALWLAQRGLKVTATDGSPRMLQVTARRAEEAGLAERIHLAQLPLQELADGRLPGMLADVEFDGVFSNFGGLNTMNDWRPLAAALSRLLYPGGKAILVLMGPLCPWEFGWHLLHGDFKTAVRRQRPGVLATIGGNQIPVWYPSARRLRRDFSSWFLPLRTESLGLWLPPSYLSHLLDRWPKLFQRLAQLERRTAVLSRGWGDHYIVTLRRR